MAVSTQRTSPAPKVVALLSKLCTSIGAAALLGLASANALAAPPHNLILFVPDGLRSQIVDAATAPAMAELASEGVYFQNSHSIFPTLTTANASAFATGHGLGDTGDFSNQIYSGFRVTSSNSTVTPFLESDAVLRQVNDHYGGNFLDEASIVAAASGQGYSTALIGKTGPTAIFALGAINGGATLIVDDSTGTAGQEVPLSEEWKAAFGKSRVSLTAPPRGDNGNAGTALVPGTWIPNFAQQQYFLEATVKVVLPRFKEAGKPFVLIFWSRDPDGTQHNQGDSLDALSPGINGKTSLSAIRAADSALATIEQALRSLKLEGNTDIVVAADHGFSTVSRSSASSPSTHPKIPYPDAIPGELPHGFLAIDLFDALKAEDASMRFFDPDDSYKELDWTAGVHSRRGNALLGADPDHPQVVVTANGGSDLIYLPEAPPASGKAAAKAGIRALTPPAQQKLAARIVAALLDQDYVSGIFVDQARFGKIPGALSTQDIGLGGGNALTPHPAIVVNFASSVVKNCMREQPALCAAEIADSGQQQGQGSHGSLSRADTWNFMAARGPDFRSHYVDPLPSSNADIGMTIAHILELQMVPNGKLTGRVLTEALGGSTAGDPLPEVAHRVLRSDSDPRHHLQTVLETQVVGKHVYLDAAGFPGRTVGLGDWHDEAHR
jgi:hypothetical protein